MVRVPVGTGVLNVVAAFAAVVVSVSMGAALKFPFPDWEYVTVQATVELVMVMVADPEPLPEQPPEPAMLTGKPELAVAATVKLAPKGALAGLCVVMVIV